MKKALLESADMFSAFDTKIMTKALRLASKGKYSTTPNPSVGCVLVNQAKQIVGQGYHVKAGQAHAEVNALAEAGKKAIDCVAYVTLEPCAHQGRTGSCALALIAAKVQKVIIACVDPNPAVSGKGINLLRQAGIAVQVGLLGEQAVALNKAFFHRMLHKRPFVSVKLAASLDGKIALCNGESKWITSTEARRDVQIHRASACAILTGADTVLADNPRLNVRIEELPNDVSDLFKQRELQPLRVVIDSQNRLPFAQFDLFNDGKPTLVYNLQAKQYVNQADFLPVIQQQVQSSAADTTTSNKLHLDLSAVLTDLAARNINHLWVESGAKLSGALFNQGLVDELILYQAPKLLGESAKGLTAVNSPNILAQAITGKTQDVCQIGPDIKTIINFQH